MDRKGACDRGAIGVLTIAVALTAWVATATTANAAMVQFAATIDQAQETPPTGSPSVWSGTFTMDTSANTLSITITDTMVGSLLGPELFAHIHGFAPPGTPAGILFGLPNGSPKNAVWNFPPADQANIIAGLTYANIHTTVNPGGEIRGQILRVPTCGDGILDGGEACDDGNNVNGDGCDSACQLEAGSDNDHYAGYQIKSKLAKGQSGTISNQVEAAGTFEKCKAKFLLVPTSKNGGPAAANPTLHYLCWQCKGGKPAVSYTVTDQFASGSISTKKLKMICNIAAKS